MFKKMIWFFGHFSPLGSPLVLSKFLHLIEVVSVSMRSLTLSLHMGSTYIFSLSAYLIANLFFLYSFNFLLVFLELFVCFIQALVFSLLLVQYLDEK